MNRTVQHEKRRLLHSLEVYFVKKAQYTCIERAPRNYILLENTKRDLLVHRCVIAGLIKNMIHAVQHDNT